MVIIEHVWQNARINTLLIDLAKESQEENTIPSRIAHRALITVSDRQ